MPAKCPTTKQVKALQTKAIALFRATTEGDRRKGEASDTASTAVGAAMKAARYLERHAAFAKSHPSYRYWCDAAATEIRFGNQMFKRATKLAKGRKRR